MVQPIANILHQDTIRRLSGDGAFDRGRRYAAQGRVSDVVRRDGAVTAKVRGSSDSYDVRIWMHEGSLAYSCNCPQGQEQAFCKHAVAVALSFVGASGTAGAPTQSTPPTPPVEDKGTPAAASTSPTPVALTVVPPVTAAPATAAASQASLSTASPASTKDGESVKDEAMRPKTLSGKPSIAASLRGLSHEELVTLILEEALEDDAFRARVLRRLSR